MIPIPPQEFRDAVAGRPTSAADFEAIGEHLRDVLLRRAGLKMAETVLDLGSGCGRAARQFAGKFRGEYHGLDVVLPMVEWCRDTISSRHTNFHFHHADVGNALYPGGKGDAARYEFPFPDATFDLVFAFSVFTHLLPAPAHRYASEIARVLRPGGRALLTFFLVNEDWRKLAAHGEALEPPFPHALDGCRVAALEVPEAAVAYEQADAVTMIEPALRIEMISLGVWSKHTDGWTWQDVILAAK
jgi:SAM-dependent methyltransferase